MTGIALAPIGALLLVACLIAIVSRRLGLPYIVGLVVAGFLVALLPSSPNLPLSRDLIFNVLLPPLVFEAALQLDWKRFRDELPLTLTLAFFGVGIATTAVAIPTPKNARVRVSGSSSRKRFQSSCSAASNTKGGSRTLKIKLARQRQVGAAGQERDQEACDHQPHDVGQPKPDATASRSGMQRGAMLPIGARATPFIFTAYQAIPARSAPLLSYFVIPAKAGDPAAPA